MLLSVFGRGSLREARVASTRDHTAIALQPRLKQTRICAACDDIKTYHYEAVAAQPGNLPGQAIDRWFWHETAAGKAFRALQQVCLESDDKSLKPLGQTSLVPRWVQHGG